MMKTASITLTQARRAARIAKLDWERRMAARKATGASKRVSFPSPSLIERYLGSFGVGSPRGVRKTSGKGSGSVKGATSKKIVGRVR